MLKSKGAIFGIGIALVASALLVAGLAITATTGAATDGSGTDLPGNISGGPADLTIPSNPGTTPGNPPASPVEPVDPTDGTGGGGTTPGTDPNAGGAGAGAGGPGSLPDAGFGAEQQGNGVATMIVLLGLVGAALIAAGASAVAAKRQG